VRGRPYRDLPAPRSSLLAPQRLRSALPLAEQLAALADSAAGQAPGARARQAAALRAELEGPRCEGSLTGLHVAEIRAMRHSSLGCDLARAARWAELTCGTEGEGENAGAAGLLLSSEAAAAAWRLAGAAAELRDPALSDLAAVLLAAAPPTDPAAPPPPPPLAAEGRPWPWLCIALQPGGCRACKG
jgi:hypothetical protein